MEKEKAEIANLVARYDRVQSLMKYVNNDTLKESYKKQPKGKAVGVDGVTKEQYGEHSRPRDAQGAAAKEKHYLGHLRLDRLFHQRSAADPV